jgi:hypothetical protein
MTAAVTTRITSPPPESQKTVRILRCATCCVAAVAVALLSGAVALSYSDRHLMHGSGWDFSSVVEEITFIALPAVGLVLASKRPRNKVGWIFLGASLMMGLGFFGERYGQRGLVAAPGSLPAARTVAWFANWVLSIPVAGLAILLLLFPTGQLSSPRWRPAVWFVAGANILYVAAWVARACRVWAAPGTSLSQGFYPGSHAPTVVLESGALLIGVAAVIVRFARSSGEERLQLKWFVTAAALVVAALIPLSLAPEMGSSPAVTSLAVSTLKVLFSLTLACLYAAIAVAVLKYRLYDIDRIISRALAYVAVTAVLAGLYAGLVLLATQVLDLTSQIAVAAATLGAAALFNPLRRRVQHRVDRRFNRARYDADNTVAAFAGRLQDATDPDAVRSDLIGTIQQALEPAQVSLWLSGGPR